MWRVSSLKMIKIGSALSVIVDVKSSYLSVFVLSSTLVVSRQFQRTLSQRRTAYPKDYETIFLRMRANCAHKI